MPSPFLTLVHKDLLLEWRQGDREALDRLTPLVYDELRRIAHRYVRLERQGHTHPYRALALRIGMLATAGALGRRLIAMNEAPDVAGRSEPAGEKR